MTVDILKQINDTIVERLSDTADTSYVASLKKKGLDAILKKVTEEATEVVMAAKEAENAKIIYEVADLWFHSMVLLAQQGLSVEQVLQELQRRQGVSGLVEKANRSLNK